MCAPCLEQNYVIDIIHDTFRHLDTTIPAPCKPQQDEEYLLATNACYLLLPVDPCSKTCGALRQWQRVKAQRADLQQRQVLGGREAGGPVGRGLEQRVRGRGQQAVIGSRLLERARRLRPERAAGCAQAAEPRLQHRQQPAHARHAVLVHLLRMMHAVRFCWKVHYYGEA